MTIPLYEPEDPYVDKLTTNLQNTEIQITFHHTHNDF
jgi:hypothetical protein